jgi:hypothetical protein
MARKIRLCKEKGCDDAETTSGYCRYHYLKNWKSLKLKHKKQSVQALNRYIEHICTKYPDNYVAAVKRDLASPDFFSRRAEGFMGEGEDEFINELSHAGGIERLMSNLKIDKAY